MKKILLILITIFLYFNIYSSHANLNKQELLLNNFKEQIEKLDKYSLEDLNIKLYKTKLEYKNSSKVLYVLSKLENALKEEISKKGIVSYIYHNFVLDFSDYKNVLGFAENVFVGKVVKNNGTYNNLGAPETHFEVEVLYNIKGKLKGNINTIFEGGYENGILIIGEGNRLLEEGGIYLLVTMGDVHKISSHENGSYLLGFEKKLKKDIKTTIKENKKIKDFREVYKESSIFNTKNKYSDMTNEEKEKYEDFDSGFVME
ncbi:hypothetical protein HUU51_04405 [Candidatus Gracilibacteria bacterium]|nr:hypothetical protein [Candidatus Gracilibacteria bacterium]